MNLRDIIKILVEEELSSSLTLYHGTNQEFDSFRFSSGRVVEKGLTSKYGFWFTDSKEEAIQYAKLSTTQNRFNSEQYEKTIEDFLKRIKIAERKGDWDLSEQLTMEMEEFEFNKENDPNIGFIYTVKLTDTNLMEVSNSNNFDQEKLILKAKSEKYDGIYFENISDSPYEKLTTNQVILFNTSKVEIVDKELVDF